MSQLATSNVHRDSGSMLIWVLLLILGGVLFFFSLDRQIVSILKTTLMHELSLSNTDYSILISAFIIPYTLMYFIVGGIVDRFGSRYVLSALMVVMSIATLITGMSTSLNGLIAGRVLLGLAESGIVPALTLAVFTWFKAEKRAFAFQLTNIIQSLGLILAPPFVAWVTLSTGWRWAFFIPAIAGVVVGLMWFYSSRRTPAAVEEVPRKLGERATFAALQNGADLKTHLGATHSPLTHRPVLVLLSVLAGWVYAGKDWSDAGTGWQNDVVPAAGSCVWCAGSVLDVGQISRSRNEFHTRKAHHYLVSDLFVASRFPAAFNDESVCCGGHHDNH
ncbi:MFS transporter [Buttiauxella agrestis]